MRTIWKYEIQGRTRLEIPKGGKVVSTDVQVNQIEGKAIWVWVLVDPEQETETRFFEVYGTGHPIPEGREWRGTFIDNIFVWHLFEDVRIL